MSALRLTPRFKKEKQQDFCTKEENHKFTKNIIFPDTSLPDHEWWQLLWPDPKSVILSLGVNSSMVSIDLCCGYGHFTAPLA